MTFQLKNSIHNEKKSNFQSNSQDFQTKTSIPNTSEFPMKPFKGTKAHLEDCHNHDSPKSKKKRKAGADQTNESQTKKIKTIDPLSVMSKLEQFSDVWNDCPNVENPKSDFEIVPINENKDERFKRENNYESKNRKSEKPNRSFLSGKGNVHSDHYKNLHDDKGKVEIKNITSNEEKVTVVADVHTMHEKYDSKVAEMKRKKAVQEQSQLHADQKNIIKKALSSVGKEQVNKKIVFSDAEDYEEPNISLKNKTKSNRLFEDDDMSGSESDFKLKVNSQFEGKKGQKLMELQSKFASDSRFTLDSRFHESESENEKDEVPSENVDIDTEKKRQLEILESIVKQPIKPLSETRKKSVNRDEPLMVRFDPTREDHQKYLLKPQKLTQEQEPREKSKKSKKEKNTLPSEESRPEVSNEKVYAVKEDLKEVLRKEDKTDFSLLKLFGSKDEHTNIQHQDKSEKVKKLKYATKNPFRYDSSESEDEEKGKEEEKETNEIVTTKPSIASWRTTFFFTENDSRFKEAEEFLKLPEELEGDKEFAEKRKMLKDFIRHKLKNSSRKKDPFKKKLGGLKQKQFHKKKGK